ncbi:MAG: hypothetical protein JW966_01420 [Anaerolineae bacterium]|nr:hypothetical protein [Anaerolineae bacterium]
MQASITENFKVRCAAHDDIPALVDLVNTCTQEEDGMHADQRFQEFKKVLHPGYDLATQDLEK